ncbi:MAG TPA: hypothetical protein VGB71_09240 [Flavisolibacter sp.]
MLKKNSAACTEWFVGSALEKKLNVVIPLRQRHYLTGYLIKKDFTCWWQKFGFSSKVESRGRSYLSGSF